MPWTNTQSRYGAIPQLAHWLTAILVAAAWIVGWFFDDLPKSAHPALLIVHITIGQCVLGLFAIRLAWRFVNPPPPAEKTRLGRLQQWAATIVHFILYALLLAVPLAGIVVQLKRGHALPIFGFWQFASPWSADRPAARVLLRVHEYFANALLILAGLHAAAALLHHYAFGDRTLRRMLPGGDMLNESAR